ncbi:MAG: S8 family serine peptidase [Candidatus Kapaibacterium sp.]
MKSLFSNLLLLAVALVVVSASMTAQPEHAKTINAFQLWDAPYNLDGKGMSIGVFEIQTKPYKYHTEFKTPIAPITLTSPNNVPYGTHPTHVFGVIMANGIKDNGLARGIAKGASGLWYLTGVTVETYLDVIANSFPSWTISNHSYGQTRGWAQDNGKWIWFGTSESASTNTPNSEDFKFGYYDEWAKRLDSMLYEEQAQIPVLAAGNQRGNGPDNAMGNYVFLPGKVVDTTSVPHPKNGASGYDVLLSHTTSKNAIVVGAVDKNNVIWANSNTGPTDDGRIKPDVVALGKDVRVCTKTNRGYGYTNASGTSFAAPAVSGALLLLQKLWNSNFPDLSFHSATARALLINTATDRGKKGPDYQYGWGVVNAKLAADMILQSAKNGRYTIRRKTLKQGEEYVAYFKAKPNEYITLTLAWTDPAGTPVTGGSFPPINNRRKMLVNDLDMRVNSISGESEGFQPLKPYVLNVANPSATATTGDNTIDNVEQISFQHNGGFSFQEYKVVISHKGNLKDGEQEFSLVIRGGVEYLLPPGSVNVSTTGTEREKDHSTLAGANSAQVSWSATAGATKYDLIYKDAAAKSWNSRYYLTSTETLLNNLEQKTYQVKVRSRNGNVVSAWSDVVQFYGGTPKPPASVWVTSVASTSAKANWSGVNGVTQYKVQWGQLSADGQLIGSWKSKTVSGTSTTMSFLTPDSRYVVYVQSLYSANLKSDVSAGKTFTTTFDCSSFSSDDTPNGARVLRVGDYLHGVICKGEEEDWYRISNPTSYKKNLKVILYSHPQGYRVSLYRKEKPSGSVSLVQGGPTGTETKILVLNGADFVKYDYYAVVWSQNPNSNYDELKPYTVTALVNSTPYPNAPSGGESEEWKKEVGSESHTFSGTQSIYPNPAIGSATLQFTVAEGNLPARIVLLDASGRSVEERNVTTVVGRNELRFDLRGVSTGIYFVSIEVNGERRTVPLSVVK